MYRKTAIDLNVKRNTKYRITVSKLWGTFLKDRLFQNYFISFWIYSKYNYIVI